MKKRLLILLVSLTLSLVLADRVLHSRIQDGRLGGLPIPPFGLQSTPQRQQALQWRIASERVRVPYVVRGGFDARYGWVNRPGRYELGGVEHHINSIGARGALEYAAQKSAGVVRMVCFGESFTYGSEVADTEAWPTRLAGLVEALEVINLAVSGWGTDQALLRFREQGPGLDADVACMGFMLDNIRRNVNRYRQLAYPRDSGAPLVKPRFRLDGGELVLVPIPYATHLELLEASYAGTMLEQMQRGGHWAGFDPSLAWSGFASVLAGLRHKRLQKLPRLWSRTEEEPFRVTLALLEAFHREALAAGVRVPLVVIFPTFEDLRDHGSETRPYWHTLHDDLEIRGVPYLDVTSALAVSAAPQELYLATHLNPRGNSVVAAAVAAWLRERLPELR